MNSARKSGILSLATLTLLASPFAQAADTGWYTGFGVGQSKAKIDNAGITRNLLGAGFTATSISNDNRDSGYKLFLGYQANPYFALEGGYYDLGQFGFSAATVPLGTFNGEIKLKGLNLDALGFIPVTENLSAFGLVGAARSEARDRFTGTGLVNVLDPNPRQTDTNYKYGLGLQYALNQNWGVRLQSERYRISDAARSKGDVDLISVSLVYRFGAEKPAPVVRTPEPVWVAPPLAPKVAQAAPPAPAPVVYQAPPRRNVTFSADSLFAFDKYAISPQGQQALGGFIAELSGTNYDVITVTGNTDRLGPHAYNMTLSERRADAVKTYLVNTGGVPVNKVNAVGVNGSNPVTKPGDCVGKKRTPKLVACLQPDRRVDVEVTGTK